MNWDGKYVVCPYWKYRDGHRISCEGPVTGTSINWIWPDNAAADDQQAIFCQKHYKRCEIYRSVKLNRYCDEDDE